MLHAHTYEKEKQLLPSNTLQAVNQIAAADQNAQTTEFKLPNPQDRVIKKISDTIESYSFYLEEKTSDTQTNSAAYIFQQALTDKIELFEVMLKDLQDFKATGKQASAEILSTFENHLAQAENALGSNLLRAAKAQIKEFISDTAFWSAQVNQLVGGQRVKATTGKTVRVPDGIEQMMRAVLPQFTASESDKPYFFKTSIVNVGSVAMTSVGSAEFCFKYLTKCNDIATERLDLKKTDASSAVTKFYKALQVEESTLREPLLICHFIKAIKAQHDALKIPVASDKNRFGRC